MPAIFFRYELSPIRIQYLVNMMSFTTFIVRVCAIVGGIYSVSSIFESVLRNSISIFGIGNITEDLQTDRSHRKKVPAKKTGEQQAYVTAPTDDSRSDTKSESIEMSEM